MCEVTLSVPDETLVALQIEPDDLAPTLRLAAAMKLYEMERLSSGAAALLAGIPRTLFLSKLAEFGVATFRLSADELRQDVENA